jgi:hypothetical protein
MASFSVRDVCTQRLAGINSSWLGPGALSCGPTVVSKASVYAAATAAPAGAGDVPPPAVSRGHVVLEGTVSGEHDDLLQRVRAVIYAQFGVMA